MTERALVQNQLLMIAAEEDLFEAAVREHARLVYRIAYSVSRNHHDTEDAAQETFIRVFRYRHKLQTIRDTKTWIARIAWRVAIEFARRHGTPSRTASELSDVGDLPSQLSSAEEFATNQEMYDLLASLIAALPEALRDTIQLSTVQDFSPAEIAEVLQISEASVRSRLFRARQILKKKLMAFEGNHGTR